MDDQAEGLRLLAHEARTGNEPELSVLSSRRPARLITITSGTKGTGKTALCANLALLLARRGRRVLLFDAGSGISCLHAMSLAPVSPGEHLLQGTRSLQELLVPGPEGIAVISGGPRVALPADLSSLERSRLFAGLRAMQEMADVLLLDAGPELLFGMTDSSLSDGEALIVTTPEPTAITEAYALIKRLSQEQRQTRLHLLVNMAAGAAEAQAAAERLALVARQFLQVTLQSPGYIPSDPALPRSMRAQRPLALRAPQSPAMRALERVASWLCPDQASAHHVARGNPRQQRSRPR